MHNFNLSIFFTVTKFSTLSACTTQWILIFCLFQKLKINIKLNFSIIYFCNLINFSEYAFLKRRQFNFYSISYFNVFSPVSFLQKSHSICLHIFYCNLYSLFLLLNPTSAQDSRLDSNDVYREVAMPEKTKIYSYVLKRSVLLRYMRFQILM